ncbi:leucine-rich repeat domain-containing protein, partial [Phocaeicola vulgatus]
SDDIIEVMPDANGDLESVTYNSGSSKIRMVGYSKAILEINNEEEITDFWVENCIMNKTLLSTLSSIYTKSGHALRYIRAIGFDDSFYSNSILNTLLAFAESDYHGINEDGNRDDSIIPVLSGKLHCSANYSPDKLYNLQSYFPHILFNMTGVEIIDFKDLNVRNICVNAWGSDGELTIEQAAAVTNLATKFKQNSVITSFDELKYFTNNLVAPTNPDVGLSYGAFLGCVNLESVTLMPNIKRLDNNIFNGCTSLKHIDIPNTIQYIGSDIFMGCTSLMTVNLPLEYMPTEFPSAIFRNCSSLTSLIEIPDTVTSIGMAAFMGCSSLEGVKMKGTTPPTLGYGVFNDTTFPI